MQWTVTPKVLDISNLPNCQLFTILAKLSRDISRHLSTQYFHLKVLRMMSSSCMLKF